MARTAQTQWWVHEIEEASIDAKVMHMSPLTHCLQQSGAWLRPGPRHDGKDIRSTRILAARTREKPQNAALKDWVVAPDHILKAPAGEVDEPASPEEPESCGANTAPTPTCRGEDRHGTATPHSRLNMSHE